MSSVPGLIVVVFEYALVAAGIGFLVWLFFRPAGKAFWRQPPALQRWDITLIEFLFLAWLLIAMGLLGQVLVRVTIAHALLRLPGGDTLQLLVMGSMFHLSALVTCLLARSNFIRGSTRVAAPRPPIPWRRVGRFAGLAFLAAMPLLYAAGLVWTPLLKVAGLPTERQELVDLFVHARSPVVIVPMTVLALVIAPIAEEAVFRAGIFRFMRTRTPRWLAFVVSAGLFALLHANWVSFLPLFVLGLIFAEAYESTGMIAVPILAHSLFNLNTLLLVLTGHS